jgi:murein L,D-transpeptidase YcbB/YkuD
MLRLGAISQRSALLRFSTASIAAIAWAFASTSLAQAPAEDALKRIIEEGNPAPLTVTLKNRIRVFIVYGTAIATEKGNILFFDDIYRHDERLEKALEARRVRS